MRKRYLMIAFQCGILLALYGFVQLWVANLPKVWVEAKPSRLYRGKMEGRYLKLQLVLPSEQVRLLPADSPEASEKREKTPRRHREELDQEAEPPPQLAYTVFGDLRVEDGKLILVEKLRERGIGVSWEGFWRKSYNFDSKEQAVLLEQYVTGSWLSHFVPHDIPKEFFEKFDPADSVWVYVGVPKREFPMPISIALKQGDELREIKSRADLPE
jgi:hypothetical protein